MKKLSSVFLMSFFVLILSGCSFNNPTDPIKNDQVKNIKAYIINSDDVNIYDFNISSDKIIIASNTDIKKNLTRLDAEWNKPIDGKTVFFSSTTNNDIFLNEKVFGDLLIVSANKKTSYSGDVVGRYKGEQGNYREIVEILMKSNVIKTYDHIMASLGLVEELEDAETYTAKFDGEHSYCTNKCTSEDFEFKVIINKETGVIKVVNIGE